MQNHMPGDRFRLPDDPDLDGRLPSLLDPQQNPEIAATKANHMRVLWKIARRRAQGKTHECIADKLALSVNTIKAYETELFDILHISKREKELLGAWVREMELGDRHSTPDNNPDTRNVEAVAGILGISFEDLCSAMKRVSQDQVHGRKPTTPGDTLPTQNLLAKTLLDYYGVTLSLQRAKGLAPYSFNIDGATPIVTNIVTKPDWTHLSVKLDSSSEHCRLATPELIIPPLPYEYALDHAARLLVSASAAKLTNQPIYRLDYLHIEANQLTAHFAVDSFFRYRFTIGLLHDEIRTTLLEQGSRMHLPLRQRLLPDRGALTDFSGRMCAGGASCLLAMARPEPFNDYEILIQLRSPLNVDGQGLISVIPQAFHQPTTPDAADQVGLASTVFREIYEELFCGKEVQEQTRRIHPDWYFKESPPFHWLHDHSEAYTSECLSFGVNLVSGDYEFAVLVAIHDPAFYDQFSAKMEPNWEPGRVSRYYSKRSVDYEGLEKRPGRTIDDLLDLIAKPRWEALDLPPDLLEIYQGKPLGWTGEGLQALIAGLKRLEALDTEREEMRINLSGMVGSRIQVLL